MTSPAELSADQLRIDVDKAITGHTGFGHVFDELQQAMAAEKNKSPQQQAQDLENYRTVINKELQTHGFPQIAVQFDKSGQMHVLNGKGHEVDVNTNNLEEKSGTPAGKPELPPGAADQFHQAVDTYAKTGHFGDFFKHIEDSAKGFPTADVQHGLDTVKPLINKELHAHGINPIDMKMGADGTVHVYDQASGKELDPDTLKAPTKGAEQHSSPSERAAGNKKPGAATESQGDYFKRHERKTNPDGSSDMTVKSGDSLWKIAEHLCEERLGHKMDPRNLKDMQAVLKMTKELAAAQNPPIEIKNGRAMITDGQKLHIPAAKDSQVQKPGEPEKPNDPAHPEKPGQPQEHPGHKSKHGKVETNGKTTKIKEDSGAEATVTVDDKGDPVDVTLKGGHWDSDHSSGHWKKVGQDEWQDDKGHKWHGQIKLGKDGTYTAVDLDTHATKTFHPDGSRSVTDGKGNASIQSGDGPHKHTYTKDANGKWVASPGGEKFDDVSLGDDGTVTGKVGNTTKKMYPDGSQVDTDEKGNTTFIQTPDGAHQHSFLREKDGTWTGNPGKDKYTDVTMDGDGNVTAKIGAGTVKMDANGHQVGTDENGNLTYIQSADGPHQMSFSKDKSGKWHSSPDKQELTDVHEDQNGNIVTKDAHGMTKTHYKNGSQVDVDGHGRMTYLRTKDGKQYNLTYNTDESTVPQTITGPNGNYYLEAEGKYYQHNGQRVKVTVKPGTISVSTPNADASVDTDGDHTDKK